MSERVREGIEESMLEGTLVSLLIVQVRTDAPSCAYSVSASSPLAVCANFCSPVLPRARILALRAAARLAASVCVASNMARSCG